MIASSGPKVERLRLIVVGAGGHASVVIDAARKAGHVVEGVVADPPGTSVLGVPVRGTVSAIPGLFKDGLMGAVTIAIGDNAIRRRLAEAISQMAPSIRFATVVHPSAILGDDCTIGSGTFVAAGAIVGPRARVGDHCLINTAASVDHDTVLQAYSSLAPRATLGGWSSIGENSAVGIGAVISHRIAVGNDSVVGAGAVVLRDIGDKVVSYGIPSREIRKRRFGDTYL